MGATYSCTSANCGKIFSKAYELRKHKATHDNPDSVFYCSECNFFTLQKKNLGIHFAKHTGEKIHECPHMIGVADSSSEERCEYKTNDPAALTKHRKKVHSYIPPPNRSHPRLSKSAPTTRQPRQKQEGKVTRRNRSSKYPAPTSRPKSSRVSHVANNSSNNAGEYTITSTESPEDFSSRFLLQEDLDTLAQWMDADFADMSGYDSSVSSSTTLVAPEEEMELNSLYDPSLRSEWMAKYEMGYSMFEVTGMKHVHEPFHAVSPVVPAGPDTQDDRGACLCPEWMIEAGVEDWDDSILVTHREFYVFDA